jgi:hypothetical protein
MDEKTIITARFTQDTEHAEKGRGVKIKSSSSRPLRLCGKIELN